MSTTYHVSVLSFFISVVQVADLDLSSSSSKYSGDKRGDRRSSSSGRYVPPHLRQQRGGSRDDDGYDDAPLPTRTSYGKKFFC